jgi:hypothetical protein
MARRARDGGVNKSAAIRELLGQNPEINAAEAKATLAKQGIKITSGLYYFIKGKIKGKRGRRRKMRRQAATVMASGAVPATSANGDALTTIKKVKGLAAELGGLKKLKALVEALSD